MFPPARDASFSAQVDCASLCLHVFAQVINTSLCRRALDARVSASLRTTFLQVSLREFCAHHSQRRGVIPNSSNAKVAKHSRFYTSTTLTPAESRARKSKRGNFLGLHIFASESTSGGGLSYFFITKARPFSGIGVLDARMLWVSRLQHWHSRRSTNRKAKRADNAEGSSRRAQTSSLIEAGAAPIHLHAKDDKNDEKTRYSPQPKIEFSHMS